MAQGTASQERKAHAGVNGGPEETFQKRCSVLGHYHVPAFFFSLIMSLPRSDYVESIFTVLTCASEEYDIFAQPFRGRA